MRLRSLSLPTLSALALLFLGACGAAPDETTRDSESALMCRAGQRSVCEFDQDRKKSICECVDAMKCAPGTVQVGSACVACGKVGQPVCGDGSCEAGAQDSVGTCVPCGTNGLPTCRVGGCAGGFFLGSDGKTCTTLRGVAHGLVWENVASGETSLWDVDGATVTRATALREGNLRASAGHRAWQIVDTYRSRVGLFDPETGDVLDWTVIDHEAHWGSTQTGPVRCTTASGCASTWKPLGAGPTRDFGLWWNMGRGDLMIRDSSGRYPDRIASYMAPPRWKPVIVAPFRYAARPSDERVDVLFHDVSSGELSFDMIDSVSGGSGGFATLAWRCDLASGCARDWHVIAAADIDGNGYADLTWQNDATGVISTWLLGRDGTVSGTATMSWTCGSSDGCASAWKARGYVDLLAP